MRKPFTAHRSALFSPLHRGDKARYGDPSSVEPHHQPPGHHVHPRPHHPIHRRRRLPHHGSNSNAGRPVQTADLQLSAARNRPHLPRRTTQTVHHRPGRRHRRGQHRPSGLRRRSHPRTSDKHRRRHPGTRRDQRRRPRRPHHRTQQPTDHRDDSAAMPGSATPGPAARRSTPTLPNRYAPTPSATAAGHSTTSSTPNATMPP